MQNYISNCLLWQNDRATATFKREFQDFIVNEVLEWDFKGQGEHIFLYVEKTNCNTVWVAKQLARFYGVPPRDVGYSGLKDRHAITRQYFSVRLPGVKPDSYDLPVHDEYRVISHVLHDKKLKRGNHPFNDFVITLHDIAGDKVLIEERLNFISEHGCPNLFDSQRFGHDNNNLTQIAQWANGDIEVRKRNDKSMLLSAFRSAVFNHQLAERVTSGSWQHLLAGDTVILDGTNSHFIAEDIDETLTQRAKEKDIHPAGVLVGNEDQFSELHDIDENHLRELMRREHLERGYRPLRLVVRDLSWEFSDDKTCVIRMRLPAGAYASGVIKQAFNI